MGYQVFRIVSALGGHDVALLGLEVHPETAVGDLKKELYDQRPDLCPPWVQILREGQLLEDALTLEQFSLPRERELRANQEVILELVYTIDIEMLFSEFPASRIMLARSLGTMGESARPYLLTLLGMPATEVSADEIVKDRSSLAFQVQAALARLQQLFSAVDEEVEGFKSVLAPIVVEMLVAGVIDAANPSTWTWFGAPVVPLLASLVRNAHAEMRIRENAAMALGYVNCNLDSAESLLLEIAETDQESSLRVAALTALGNVCSTPQHAYRIVKLANREREQSVKDAATHAVTLMGTSSQHSLVRSLALRSMARR